MNQTNLLERRLTFFGGKGGAGKTTCAAAFALLLAKRGLATLVVSTDPAHSLGDMFQKRIGSKRKQLHENLWGLEIDPEREARRYMKRVRQHLGAAFSSVIVDEIRRQIDAAYLAPGAEESAIFDKFVELMDEQDSPFDRIVFDTAPTGHTLRLLTLPELLGAWVERLIEKRQRALQLLARVPDARRPKPDADPVLALLQARKERFIVARACLLDRDNTGFVFVMDAERLSMAETRRAIDLLLKHGIRVEGVVINRILPESADPFLQKRRELQRQRLRAIERKFGGLVLGALPCLDREVEDFDSLNEVAASLARICQSPGPPP